MTERAAAIRGGLLVSVRDAAEAAAALAGGADIVDVKDPAAGPLGAPDPRAAADVAAVVGCRVPWTVACGELAAGAAHAARLVVDVASRLTAPTPLPVAAKAGPAGLSIAAWADAHAAFRAGLPAGVEAIAVAYADWRQAAAPDPADLIAAAAAAGTALLLVDTFHKQGPGTLAVAASLANWVRQAHACGMRVALAGRIEIAEIAPARMLGGDVIAVRGAVCRGGRDSPVDRQLVSTAATLVRATGRGMHVAPNASGVRP